MWGHNRGIATHNGQIKMNAQDKKSAKQASAEAELKAAYDAYIASKPKSLGMFQSPKMLRSLGII